MRKYILVPVVIFAASCTEGTEPELPATVTVSPTPMTLDAIGKSAALTTAVKSQSGASMSVQGITWSTSAPAVATVAQDGKVTAVGEGDATITAKVIDGVQSTAAVTVRATFAITVSMQAMQNKPTDAARTTATTSFVVQAAP